MALINLGLRYNVLPAHQMAPITSGVAVDQSFLRGIRMSGKKLAKGFSTRNHSAAAGARPNTC